MRTVPGLVEVNSNASLVQPEILIIPPARAAFGSDSTSDRPDSLATIGDKRILPSSISPTEIPIRVQITPRRVMTRLEIFGLGKNNTVPLVAVADIRFGSGPAQISRYDRVRCR